MVKKHAHTHTHTLTRCSRKYMVLETICLITFYSSNVLLSPKQILVAMPAQGRNGGGQHQSGGGGPKAATHRCRSWRLAWMGPYKHVDGHSQKTVVFDHTVFWAVLIPKMITNDQNQQCLSRIRSRRVPIENHDSLVKVDNLWLGSSATNMLVSESNFDKLFLTTMYQYVLCVHYYVLFFFSEVNLQFYDDHISCVWRLWFVLTTSPGYPTLAPGWLDREGWDQYGSFQCY